jgi:hypothetical protein
LKFSFDFELSSPEATIGIYVGVIAAVVIVILLLLRGRRPNITQNMTTISNSPGAAVSLDQSKHTNVAVSTAAAVNVSKVNHAPAAPAEQKPAPAARPRNSGGGTGNDDVSALMFVAGGALVAGVYFFVRHFDSVAFGSRLECFAAFSFAVVAFPFDLYRRGVRGDEIQASLFLSGVISFIAAALLLQAQALVTPEMIAASADEPNVVKLVFQRLTHAELRLVMISLVSTVATCFVALTALLSILRAIVLSWFEGRPLNGFARAVLKVTHGTRPAPLAIIAIVLLGAVAAMPYFFPA